MRTMEFESMPLVWKTSILPLYYVRVIRGRIGFKPILESSHLSTYSIDVHIFYLFSLWMTTSPYEIPTTGFEPIFKKSTASRVSQVTLSEVIYYFFWSSFFKRCFGPAEIRIRVLGLKSQYDRPLHYRTVKSYS